MKRKSALHSWSTDRRPKLSPLAKQLVQYANQSSHAGSALERNYWFEALNQRIDELLLKKQDKPLQTALAHLATQPQHAHESLMQAIVRQIESPTWLPDHDLLLFAVPVLAWSLYPIPCGSVDTELGERLRNLLSSLIFADGVQLSLFRHWFSPDSFPDSFVETRAFTASLLQAHQQQQAWSAQPAPEVEQTMYFADTRYLLGLAVIPRGQPIFRWQIPLHLPSSACGRDGIAERWHQDAMPIVQRLLPGAQLRLLLPDAHHAACSRTENAAREFSLLASLSYLEKIAKLAPKALIILIAPFYEQNQLAEYRISFTIDRGQTVIHGLLWPLQAEEALTEPDPVLEAGMPGTEARSSTTEADDRPPELLSQLHVMLGLLQQQGVGMVQVLQERFMVEYCDDCGSMLFPDITGDLCHPELEEHIDADDDLPSALH